MNCCWAIRNIVTGQYIIDSGKWGSVPKMWRTQGYPSSEVLRRHENYLTRLEQSKLPAYQNNYWNMARLKDDAMSDLSIVEVVKLDFNNIRGEEQKSGMKIFEDSEKKRCKLSLIHI